VRLIGSTPLDGTDGLVGWCGAAGGAGFAQSGPCPLPRARPSGWRRVRRGEGRLEPGKVPQM